MKEHLVFAYGSNLNSTDFHRYCREKGIPGFVPKRVCNAHIPNWTLSWSYYSKARSGGALNIEPKTKDKQIPVQGTVFALTDEQLSIFDKKEGHPKNYLRTSIIVHDPTDNEMLVETYIAPPCRETRWFFPTRNYCSVVADGMHEQGIPDEYILYFKNTSPVIDSLPFAGESKKKTAIYSGLGVTGQTICYWQNLYEKNDLGSLDILYSHLFSLEKLSEYDLLILPGGDSKNICAGLGDREKCDVREYLRNGGKYLGVCAGAYAATHESQKYLGISPVKIVDYDHAHRGEATLKILFNNEGRKWFGLSDSSSIPIIYHNGPVPYESPISECFDYQILATFEEEISLPEGKPDTMINQPAAWMNRYGAGRVFAVSPHIERTPGKEFLMVNLLDNILTT